ncbi:hypothetical protein E2C01_040815 [Portunus trituberculatus]|uniref:Uncharacterized protein n=1 Tax=Portunus trituberculatus TaxID=210409 RepID=A0A5B7FHL9_PORTR|nr:hypothetical protein [Portunus trituberculatus]
MYSSDMQEAYSALVRGTKAAAQCSEEGRRQGQWQGKRAVENAVHCHDDPRTHHKLAPDTDLFLTYPLLSHSQRSRCSCPQILNNNSSLNVA